MLWGLLAALGWGGADVLGALSGRKIGSVRTALIAQAASLVLLWIAVAIVRPPMGLTPATNGMVAVSGFLAGLAYLCLFRSLELGPVAIVSPIVGSYAAVTIGLSLVFGGESATLAGAFGMVAALVGVVLASTDIGEIRERGGIGHLQGGGIPWAIGALLCFGVASYFLGQAAQELGALPATTYGRTGNVLTIVVFALFQLRHLRSQPRLQRKGFLLACGVGAVDVVGTLSFAIGATGSDVSLVSAASVAFVLIPLTAGLVLFGERPGKLQYLGIASIVGGLLLLGLAA